MKPKLFHFECFQRFSENQSKISDGAKKGVPYLKGSVLALAKPGRGDPLPDLRWVTSMASNFASFRSYPKSFRIWSFQTDVTSGFQGFCLKLSHLGEIFVQSWKIGGEFDILTTIRK